MSDSASPFVIHTDDGDFEVTTRLKPGVGFIWNDETDERTPILVLPADDQSA
jgi:hypothetical protein